MTHVSRVLAVCAMAIAFVGALRPLPATADASEHCSGEQLVTGANWSICWEVRAHEGLTINHAFFTKPGIDRRVLSGATLAQMFVAYEPGQPRYHDVAYGMGPAMQPLPAEACHGRLLYDGRVCAELHDRGLAEFFCAEGNCHSRLGEALVVWGSSQMGAYNYLVTWEFFDDGTIEPAVGLSGVLQLGNTDHTHNAYWRLDVDIEDAGGDHVEEYFRIVPAWSDGRRGASGWVPLLAETFRANDLDTFRRWRVVDDAHTNAQGNVMGYELLPHTGDGNYRTVPEEGFSRGELWVTRARDEERFVSTETSDLLSGYLDGESVAAADVVLWYVIHEHHHVRDEDAPYMPTEWIHYQLRPRNFFDENPM